MTLKRSDRCPFKCATFVTLSHLLHPFLHLLSLLPFTPSLLPPLSLSLARPPSKALMDLLVELCGRHHLNPALHTLELVSPAGRHLAFKPNVLLGSLDVASVHIKEKGSEEKAARRPAPKVPEVRHSDEA